MFHVNVSLPSRMHRVLVKLAVIRPEAKRELKKVQETGGTPTLCRLLQLAILGGLVRVDRSIPNPPTGRAYWITWAVFGTILLGLAVPAVYVAYQEIGVLGILVAVVAICLAAVLLVGTSYFLEWFLPRAAKFCPISVTNLELNGTKSEAGQGLAEYGLIIALVAVLCVAALGMLDGVPW